MENWQHREASAGHSLLKQQMLNGDNVNLDIGRIVTCGVGRNIFFYGSKEADQKMKRSRRPDQKGSSRAM
jgi:hypothetical protein